MGAVHVQGECLTTMEIRYLIAHVKLWAWRMSERDDSFVVHGTCASKMTVVSMWRTVLVLAMEVEGEV